jgi:hypothetical protein
MDVLLDPGMVLYLPLYEAGHTVFMTRDAIGHCVTVHGAEWTLRGRHFDGLDDWISVPVSPALTTPDRGTILIWVKRKTTTQGVFCFSDKDAIGINEATMATNVLGFAQWRTDIGGPASQELRTPQGSLPQDEWMCIIFTSDGTKTYGDINGIPQPLSVATGSNNGDWVGDCNQIDSLGVGSLRRPAPVYWEGTIGEVVMWNRYLTPPERQQAYHATKWRYR